ncbi:hypothetical protein EIP86_000791 [Pleurotus ostreatoroseus]|nr:hypothetical protein EIP86_000791 [Pleurotus ostreatoroseus]
MDCLLALLCIDRSWYHPIPVLPVLWDHQVPYFSMHEEPGRPGIVDLVGLHEWIVLAGHRRLIVGRTQNVIATYPTHAVLSVHSSASDQMLDIGEVHVSIPYTALTPWLRRYISLRRWFRADLKDREFATLPEHPANDIVLSHPQCPVQPLPFPGVKRIDLPNPHDPNEHDSFIRHVFWRVEESYGEVHPACRRTFLRGSEEVPFIVVVNEGQPPSGFEHSRLAAPVVSQDTAVGHLPTWSTSSSTIAVFEREMGGEPSEVGSK